MGEGIRMLLAGIGAGHVAPEVVPDAEPALIEIQG
jgi:hypothetical protein